MDSIEPARLAVEVDLELGAHAGEGAAELVRSVGHELLLAPDRRLDAVEHGVSIPPQGFDQVETQPENLDADLA